MRARPWVPCYIKGMCEMFIILTSPPSLPHSTPRCLLTLTMSALANAPTSQPCISAAEEGLRKQARFTLLASLRRVADFILEDGEQFFMPLDVHIVKEQRVPKPYASPKPYCRDKSSELAFCFAMNDWDTAGTNEIGMKFEAILSNLSARDLVERMMFAPSDPWQHRSSYHDKYSRLDDSHSRDYLLTRADAEYLLDFADKLQDEDEPYTRPNSQMRQFIRCILVASIERCNNAYLDAPALMGVCSSGS